MLQATPRLIIDSNSPYSDFSYSIALAHDVDSFLKNCIAPWAAIDQQPIDIIKLTVINCCHNQLCFDYGSKDNYARQIFLAEFGTFTAVPEL